MFAKIYSRIQLLRFIPHIIVYARSRERELLDYERDMYLRYCNGGGKNGWTGFLYLLTVNKAYRSLFYWRTDSPWLEFFAKGENNLHFVTPSAKVGKGLMIWHGYSTIINAAEVGENFQIWHNVTVGKKSTDPVMDKPIIGNNVKVCTGAVVVGPITIGDNCTVGANATVVKDLPASKTAVGQAVRIL